MATIRKRGNSYQIRVSAGYDSEYRQVIHTKTWKPTPGMTERQKLFEWSAALPKNHHSSSESLVRRV